MSDVHGEARSARSATVDVLTAEVRVLMVGRRQVTMSVFSQLDKVPHSEIAPFGRVNPKDANRNEIHLVGSGPDGTLVRSRIWRWPHPGSHKPYYLDSNPGGSDQYLFDRAKEERKAGVRRDWCTQSEWETMSALPLIVLAGLR